MVVDIAPQQQLNEVFTTTRIHHRSSSSSIHRRSSTTTTTTSSLVSTENNTMTNGDRSMSDELSKKAEQILGQATDFFACRRQNSLDFQSQHAPRLNITAIQTTLSSRNNMSQSVSSTTVHNSTTTSSQSVNSVTGDSSNGKNKRSVTVEQLVPIILQLVAPTDFIPFPEMSSRRRSNSKLRENMRDSREMTVVLHRNNVLQLSDDENEEEQDDENEDEPENDLLADDDDDDDEKNNNTNHFIENSTTVLTEITDNKTNSNSINQQTSNDNPLPPSQPPAHVYENQVEPQHSGISSSRSQDDDDDSEDEDSDTNPEAAYSDAENEDGQNETNPKMLSLMDFVCVKEIHSEPIESSLKSTSDSISNVKKRSISPEPASNEDNHRVHNCEEHQNKRKKLLIKRALLKSFKSSVNTKINFKRPSLPITIPTYLFFDQTSAPVDSNQSFEDERTQRTSKRSINGTLKHEPSSDPMDNSLPLSSSSSNNQTTIHQKKNKTSHVQEKILSKQQDSTTTISTNEQTALSNSISSNEIESTKTRGTILSSSNNTATVSPIIAPQPKKEKPTANVKPLLQSTPMENLSLTNSINNGINSTDSLTTSNTRAILPSNKTNYTRLKNMSKTDLAAVARKKKKQADFGKRVTFAEAREAMGLYLESVCYYIQCANVESKQDQRTSLLTTTLTMLQQLAQNHKKMFNISNSNQSGDLLGIQQKFLLINYWLQSLIYHLQLNTHMPTIERYANQVIDYFNQSKNPSSTSRNNTSNPHQQSTPINDTNPISPLSTTSQTSSSDMSTSSGNEQHRYIYDFSKLMLNSYHSTYYWNKAESLMREKTLKEFTEQLLKQNQNRRLSRDDPTLEFIVYIFDSIELLRLSVA